MHLSRGNFIHFITRFVQEKIISKTIHLGGETNEVLTNGTTIQAVILIIIIHKHIAFYNDLIKKSVTWSVHKYCQLATWKQQQNKFKIILSWNTELAHLKTELLSDNFLYNDEITIYKSKEMEPKLKPGIYILDNSS